MLLEYHQLPSRFEAPNCDRECSDCFKLLKLTNSAEKTAGRHSGSVLPTRFSRWTLKSPTKGLINSKNGWRLSSAELTWHLPQSRIDGANANTTATHRQKNWTPMLFFSNKTNRIMRLNCVLDLISNCTVVEILPIRSLTPGRLRKQLHTLFSDLWDHSKRCLRLITSFQRRLYLFTSSPPSRFSKKTSGGLLDTTVYLRCNSKSSQ